jgi:hypothetical protein
MDNNAQIQYLLSTRRKTNHVLHLLLSFVTCFFWLPVWILISQSTGRHNRRIDRQIKRLV